MYTKAEIKKLPKGFTESRTEVGGNRKKRRAHLSMKGIKKNGNNTRTLIVGKTRFLNFYQWIFDWKRGGKMKRIEHSIAIG